MLAFSPDNTLLASGSNDRTVKVWDLKSQRLISDLATGAVVFSVCFAPDGQSLAALSGGVRVWDVVNEFKQIVQTGHSRNVASVATSPDGKTAVTRGEDGNVEIWDTRSRTLIHHIHTSQGDDDMSLSPDGQTIATIGPPQIGLWDVATGKRKGELVPETNENAACVQFSPDGKLIAAGYTDGVIRIWDVETQQLKKTLEGHTDHLMELAFSPDRKTLVSAAYSGRFIFWDVETGKPLFDRPNPGHIRSITFSRDGKTLAVTNVNSTIMLWDAATGASIGDLKGHADEVLDVAFAHDGKTLASASTDRTIKLWDLATGEVKSTLNGHTGSVSAVVFSANGNALLSGGSDGTLRFWRAASQADLVAEESRISARSLAFSPDGKTLALGRDNGKIKLWDTFSHQHRFEIRGHTAPIDTVAFSPDGTLLASGSLDNTVRLWDARSGDLISALPGHRAGASSVAFSPDGRWFASSGWDSLIKLYQLDGLSLQGTFEGYSAQALSFSPDSRSIATADVHDHGVVILEVPSGHVVAKLAGHTDRVTDARFSPDDATHLCSTSRDGTMRVWDLESRKEVIQESCSRTWLNLGVFSKDGRSVYWLDADAGVGMWDISTRDRRTPVPKKDASDLATFALSPDGKMLATSRWFSEIRLWNGTTGELLDVVDDRKMSEDYAVITAIGDPNQTEEERQKDQIRQMTAERHLRTVAFSSDGQTVASGGVGALVELWDAASGDFVRRLDANGEVNALDFSPDGKYLAAGGWGKMTTKVWHTDSWEMAYEIEGHSGRTCVGFSPDGRTLATSGADCVIRLLDLSTGKMRSISTGHQKLISSVVFSPDAKTLAVACEDSLVTLWDVASRKQIQILEGHADIVFAVAYSPDGKTLATGDRAGILKLWDVTDFERVSTVDLGVSGVLGIRGLAFSPDGRQLAIGTIVGPAGGPAGGQGEVIVWNVADKTRVNTRRMPHLLGVHCMRLSPDGQILASAGYEGYVKL